MNIPESHYRISIKALIYNSKGEFLLCKEEKGIWDLAGGGLDHGENIETCLKRELKEEMGLDIIEINKVPKYFITVHKPDSKTRPWIANICYEIEVQDLEFTPSEECVEIGFFNVETALKENILVNVKEILKEIKM